MAYLDTIKADAFAVWHSHQILPSITGVQAAHESGWGTSDLSKAPYYNQFGIKASPDWTGRTVNMLTQEHVNGSTIWIYADFRAYDSVRESIADYAAFFTSTEWRKENYKHVVGERDYKKAAWALQNSGYATDPNYATKLIRNIENAGLQKWDTEVLNSQPPSTGGNGGGVAEEVTIDDKFVGGDLTEAARVGVRSLEVSWIGDSLGVGTKPFAEELVPLSNFDVLGSRQITHQDPPLNALQVIYNMVNAGTLKEYVVFIIGTNRGVTRQEIDDVVAAITPNRKIILVSTGSEVNHAGGVQGEYYGASERHENVFYADWRAHSQSMKAAWFTPDGAGGKYIHMTPEGYRKHAEFLTQALYEVATGNFTERTAEAPQVVYSGIKDYELTVDGIVKYYTMTKQVWQDDGSYKLEPEEKTHDLGIKGFYSPMGSNNIYYPEGNQRWGYGVSYNNDMWMESTYINSQSNNPLVLIEGGVRDLLSKSQPDVTYKVSLRDMDPNISIGDTGIFIDHEYNPPIYFSARVSSITTSQTDPTLSTVTITNVNELQSRGYDALEQLRDEINQSRATMLQELRNSEVVQVRINSTNGNLLQGNLFETQLITTVVRGGADITHLYDRFVWERTSSDGVADLEFNGFLSLKSGNALKVFKSDVVGKDSVFTCRVYSKSGQLVGNQNFLVNVSDEISIASELGSVQMELDNKLEVADLDNAFLNGIKIGGRTLTGEQLDQLLALINAT